MIKIDKAKIKDLEAVKKLNQELFNYDFKFDKTLDLNWPKKNKKYYAQRIKSKNSITLIAKDGKTVIAYLVGSLMKVEGWRKLNKLAELENMLVLEKYRGQGIGSSLIKEFLKWAKTKKADRVKVIASSENLEAINAYKNNKFIEYNVVLEREI